MINRQYSLGERITVVISLVTTAIFPCLFMYCNNAGKAYFYEVLPLCGVFTLTSFVLFLLFFIIQRKEIGKAAILTNISMLAVLNYAFIENGVFAIFPNLYYWHVVYLIVVVIAAASYFTRKKLKEEIVLIINTALCFALCALILVNIVTAIPQIIQKSQNRHNASVNEIVSAEKVEDLPPIYILIFDEYGGFDCLKEYCGYDNSAFYNALETIGFNTSKYSYCRTLSTIQEIPNMLNLEQLDTSDWPDTEKGKRFYNPKIYKYLRSKGYKINIADSWNKLDRENCDYCNDVKEISEEESIVTYILKNTIVYPFFNTSSDLLLETINEQFEYILNSNNTGNTEICTISYMSCPHLPWFIDSNGNSINAADARNWKKPSIYLGQLQWLNAKIIHLVDNLIKQNENCIIIMLSDHGFRYVDHMEEWYNEIVDFDRDYQFNILDAVYYKGESLEIEGKTSIDTLIYVMNRLFNDNMQMYGL